MKKTIVEDMKELSRLEDNVNLLQLEKEQLANELKNTGLLEYVFKGFVINRKIQALTNEKNRTEFELRKKENCIADNITKRDQLKNDLKKTEKSFFTTAAKFISTCVIYMFAMFIKGLVMKFRYEYFGFQVPLIYYLFY